MTQLISRTARLATVAALMALANPAVAQQATPGSMAAARELIAITGATALLNPLIPGVVEQAKLLFLQQNPMIGRDLNEVADKLRNDLAPRFAEVTEAVAKVYAVHFTEQELKDIVAFYKTPAGSKMLNQQPQLIDESMKFAQTWSNALSDEVIGKFRDELKKKGHNL